MSICFSIWAAAKENSRVSAKLSAAVERIIGGEVFVGGWGV